MDKDNKESKQTTNHTNVTSGINPIVSQAMKFMSPEDLQRYKDIGIQFYGSIDFENSEILTNKPPPDTDDIDYIIESLKSGLLPSMLETDEQEKMKQKYGDKWYQQFGYTDFE